MKCPTCQSEARCSDSRPHEDYRRRRYVCTCGVRFTTVEMVAYVGDERRGPNSSPMVAFRQRLLAECLAEVRPKLHAALDALIDKRPDV